MLDLFSEMTDEERSGAIISACDAYRNLTDAEIAWLAGVYEGEGSFVVTEHSPSRRRSDRTKPERWNSVHVTLSMTDEDVVSRVAALVGRPDKVRKQSLRIGQTKCAYILCLSKRVDVYPLLKAIWPWMGKRRRVQIQRLFDLLDIKQKKIDDLTDRVRAIRLLVAQGCSQASVALRFGMHQNSVQLIAARKRYKNIQREM